MLNYTVEEFFNRNKVEEFHDNLELLLKDVFASNSSIIFLFENEKNSVSLHIGNESSANDSIILFGNGPQGVSRKKINSIGNNVFLPFVLSFSKIKIPHDKLYFLGRNDKSMSEFLMRNLIANLILKTSFLTTYDGSVEWGCNLHIRFIERYLWYFKPRFFTGASASKVSIEKMLSACFLEINEFDENPKLYADLKVIRSVISPNNLTLTEQLLIVRDEVMQQCHS